MAPKLHTSENSPLHIADIPVGPGLMGLTLCPGKQQEDAWTGPCRRNLEMDMQRIKDWGANIIVTLMEEHELRRVHVMDRENGLPDIGDLARSLGMLWWHIPVVDQTPLETVEEMFKHGKEGLDTLMRELPAHLWLRLDFRRQLLHGIMPRDHWALDCAVLRHCLHSGGRVLIHCRGGLGRTGSLAARLLIDDGMDAETAMRVVRESRSPHCVDPGPQEEYLRDVEHYRYRYSNIGEVPDNLPQERVAQLVRLFLEIPWAFPPLGEGKGEGDESDAGAAWKATVEICPKQAPRDTVPYELLDKADACLRDVLCALYGCYDADGDNLRRAREYFGYVEAPRPHVAGPRNRQGEAAAMEEDDIAEGTEDCAGSMQRNKGATMSDERQDMDMYLDLGDGKLLDIRNYYAQGQNMDMYLDLGEEKFLDIRYYKNRIDRIFGDPEFQEITVVDQNTGETVPLLPRSYHYPAFVKEGSILFVGINPSYTNTHDWPVESQPKRHFYAVNDYEHDVLLGDPIEGPLTLEKMYEHHKRLLNRPDDFRGYEYSFFNPMRRISQEVTGSEDNWSHLDLFFFRESSQACIYELNKSPLGAKFLVRNLELSLELLAKTKPAVIVVANGGARDILTGKYRIPGFTPPTWDIMYDKDAGFKQVRAKEPYRFAFESDVSVGERPKRVRKEVSIESLTAVPIIMTIMLAPFFGPGLTEHQRKQLEERIKVLYHGDKGQILSNDIPQNNRIQQPERRHDIPQTKEKAMPKDYRAELDNMVAACNPITIKPEDFKHNAIAVKIHDSYKGDFYEAARGNWWLKKENADKVELLIAEHDNVFLAVYKIKPNSWRESGEYTKGGKPRLRCDAEPVDFENDPEFAIYINRSVATGYGPLRYFWKDGRDPR